MRSRRDSSIFFPGELRALSAALALAVALFAAVALIRLGDFLMKRIAIVAALSAAAIALSGCGTTGQAVLNNINQSCDRQYEGTISGSLVGGSFTGTLKANCHAADGKSTPAAAPPKPLPA